MIAELCGSDRVQIVVEKQALGLQIAWADISLIRGRCSSSFPIFAGNFFNSKEWHLLGKVVFGRIAIGLIDEELLGIGIADVL